MTETVERTPLTNETALEKFKAVYNEVFDLEQDLKDIKEEADADGLDGAGLKAIAKAIVYRKLADLVAKYNKALELIEEVA